MLRFLFVLLVPYVLMGQEKREDIPSFIIKKRVYKPPFEEALQLPNTATSCDCPPASTVRPLRKVGCLHPDIVAVCKVIITKFDLAIIPEKGETVVIEDIEGSFLNKQAYQELQLLSSKGRVFISYSNIQAMTEDGRIVILPPFGSTNIYSRATRSYSSIEDFISHINTENIEIETFELTAFNDIGNQLFRQQYKGTDFDKNAMRPDATRFIFRAIKAKHLQGFDIAIDSFEVNNINQPSEKFYLSGQ